MDIESTIYVLRINSKMIKKNKEENKLENIDTLFTC